MKKRIIALVVTPAAVILTASVAWALTWQMSGSDRYLPNGAFLLYDPTVTQIGAIEISGVTSFGSGGNWVTYDIHGFPTNSGTFTWGGSFPNEIGIASDSTGPIAKFVPPASGAYCEVRSYSTNALLGYFQ